MQWGVPVEDCGYMANYHIPTDKEIAEKAKALINADLSHHYSVNELAGEIGVFPYTLKRIFKKMTGRTLAEFALEIRINRAKELLTTTNNTLQMIAEELGYTEGNNFQQTFKRVVGVTPGEWRRRSPGNLSDS